MCVQEPVTLRHRLQALPCMIKADLDALGPALQGLLTIFTPSANATSHASAGPCLRFHLCLVARGCAPLLLDYVAEFAWAPFFELLAPIGFAAAVINAVTPFLSRRCLGCACWPCRCVIAMTIQLPPSSLQNICHSDAAPKGGSRAQRLTSAAFDRLLAPALPHAGPQWQGGPR